MDTTIDEWPAPVPTVGRHRGARPRGPTRVVVASDQALVADSVGAALGASGFATTTVAWPGSEGDRIDVARWSAAVQASTETTDVGVLLCDFDRLDRLLAARLLLGHTSIPWVVLTGASPGPLWGAVIERGARAVLTSATTVAQLADAVREVERGASGMTPEVATRYVEAWHRARDERYALVRRLQRLSPREVVVLRLLYAGGRVGSIAERFGVTEATVRSQVRSVLRKLEVNSQLAAVAAYASVQAGQLGVLEDGVVPPGGHPEVPLPNIEETGPPPAGGTGPSLDPRSNGRGSRRRRR